MNFIVADDNLSAAKEYLTNKRYWCAQKSKNSNRLVYTNSYSSLIGNFVLHFLVENNKIRISMFIKSTEKRLFRRGFSKHGLYGIVMYPAKIRFRKHLAVVLELLDAPKEFKI